MGKLSVLGAQRIKALEGMLDEKMNEELAQVKKSDVDASKIARTEYGIEEAYQKAKKLLEQANELLQEVSTVTGDVYSASQQFHSNYRAKTAYKQRRDEILDNNDIKQVQEAIKKKYTHKKQMLWLCETLEEAKQIVGIE